MAEKVGRPLKFKSVEELQQKIDEYFDSCYVDKVERDDKGKVIYDNDGKPIIETVQVKPPTISGLAHFLDTTRRTLLDYEERNEDYSHTISRAKTRIEAFTEEQLFTPKIANGVAFSLKNNYGWKDKTEVDSNVNMEFTINDPFKD